MRKFWNWLLNALGFGVRPTVAKPPALPPIRDDLSTAPRDARPGVATSLRYDQVERRRKLRKKRAKGLV